MRVLIDILHPAQVHFFKNLIFKLKRDRHEVLVTAREKDVATHLLDALGIEYHCLSRAGSGPAGKLLELPQRWMRLLRLCRRFRPDVMLAQTGVSIGPVGALLEVPRLALEEAEHARLQQIAGLPFATYIFTGTGYNRRLGARQVRFRGIWVQSYLHPRYFRPNPEPLIAAGIDPDEPYIVLRLVSWSAVHDIGLRGADEREALEALERLSRFGRVIISSERPLPEALKPYLNPVPPQHMHDLLAFASLYIGEGGTMAAEAAVLGVPSIFCSRLRCGYLTVLQDRYGLLRCTDSIAEGLEIAEKWLAQGGIRQIWRARNRKLWTESEDITEFMCRLIERVVSRRR